MADVNSSRNGSVLSAAFILGVASLFSRGVGLIRERVFTTTFGAGDVFDAFVAAFRIPDLIFNLVVVGALSAAFIPLFTEKLVHEKNGTREAFRFAGVVFNTVLLLVIAFSALYALLADYIVPVITPGFSGEKLALTVQLSRVMALQPIFLGASFVFSGVLNSFKRFMAYALAPIVYNIGIILGVLVLVPLIGIAGIGWGVVLGAALHMLVQLPSMWKVGWRWQPRLRWSSRDLHVLWRMILPRVVGLAAQQVNLLTVTMIGSSLLAGSIAVFHLANNVQHVPIGIFGIAFAQAAFPTLAEQIARKQRRAFVDTLTRTFRYILFFVVPLSVFLLLLRAQLIRILFGAGAFDWEDTILTFETFGWLIISIFAQATIPLLTRAFYVQQDTKTPVILSVTSMVLNVVLAVILAPFMGVQGLALAFSVSALVHVVLLLGMLHWRLGGFNDREVIFSLLRIAVAAILAGLVVQGLKYPVAALVNMQRFWGVFTQLTVTSIGGAGAYLFFCWVFRLPELVSVIQYIPRALKLAKLKPDIETQRFGGLPD